MATNDITIYRIDPKTSLFLYAEKTYLNANGSPHMPGNCITEAPPQHAEKQWPRWDSNVPRTNHQFGQAGTGSWIIIPDYRKETLYKTEDGQEYKAGTKYEVNGVEENYPGYGDLPSWLTDEKRPSQFHNWDGTDWEPDQAAIDKNEQDMERGWRDAEINRVEWLRNRHLDELAQEIDTTLTNTEYEQLLGYIQELRDWPANPNFPNQASRPVMPSWLQD